MAKKITKLQNYKIVLLISFILFGCSDDNPKDEPGLSGQVAMTNNPSRGTSNSKTGDSEEEEEDVQEENEPKTNQENLDNLGLGSDEEEEDVQEEKPQNQESGIIKRGLNFVKGGFSRVLGLFSKNNK